MSHDSRDDARDPAHGTGSPRPGRSELKAARTEGTLPAYVFDGPAAHRDRRLRRVVAGTAIPAGLGRSLIRMGRAADPDHGHDYEDGGDPDSPSGSHSSPEPGGFSCGSGGGGGGSD
ncbi:hypothetical protein [Streptomyces sp. S4.7]|uniref:hypothetical protein n=1 Tax=Streptomyces sp. S4.7 TaxID=2705439 RepID=UPI0013DD67CA|nr:hypothetical protein [Streptomyces sp. S4.7]